LKEQEAFISPNPNYLILKEDFLKKEKKGT